jgi:chitinase
MKIIVSLLVTVIVFAVFPGTVSAQADVSKELTVYFVNWAVYADVHQRQRVRDLPWDRLSTINHAFWRIAPNEDYTAFPISSFDPWADFDMRDSHFSQYALMHEQYPDVKILITVGGWSHPVRDWSLMVSTPETRLSFIESCLYWMERYPWIAGFDLDWEYPGTSRNREGVDFTGSPDDRDNFTQLVHEMRMTFDTSGFADRIISVCIPAGTLAASRGQNGFDHAAIAPYVHRLNVMTYDMVWSGTTQANHHSALYPGSYAVSGLSVYETVNFLLERGVPPNIINIGTPLYSHGWKINASIPENALGSRVTGAATGTLGPGQRYNYDLRRYENTPGWHTGFDPVSRGAFLFNYDTESPYFQTFYTYESERSLQAKLDFINEKGLGGIIVWSAPGDSIQDNFPMLTRMAVGLGIYDGEVPELPPLPELPELRGEPEILDLPTLPGESETPSMHENNNIPEENVIHSTGESFTGLPADPETSGDIPPPTPRRIPQVTMIVIMAVLTFMMAVSSVYKQLQRNKKKKK